MSTYSSDLRIELIANGAQAGTWGTTTNNTWAYVIDPAITGFQTVAVASANQALTYVSGSTATASANQAIYASLAFTTGLGTSFSVYAPPTPKQYIIWNNSSQSMTLYNSSVIGNTTPAGTGVSIPAGKKVQVFSDGTNFYSVDAANLTGTLAVGNGGTGVTTLSGLAYGNGTSAFTAASAAQIVAAIGSTAVTNATNATNATNPASGGSFITSSNIGSQSVSYASTAGNGGVTSVNGLTGAVTISVPQGSRAWVIFDGTGSSASNQSIYGSYNVAYVYKVSTGIYQVYYSSVLSTANNAVLVSGRLLGDAVCTYTAQDLGNTTAYTTVAAASNVGGTAVDPTWYSVAVFGN